MRRDHLKLEISLLQPVTSGMLIARLMKPRLASEYKATTRNFELECISTSHINPQIHKSRKHGGLYTMLRDRR